MATTSEPFGWYPDANGIKQWDGDIGGDGQVTGYWDVRLINDQNQSIINVSAYGEGFDWDYDTETYLNGYGVTVQVEFMECKDRTDPGGTEISCNYQYDNDADVRAYGEADVESGVLLEACKRVVERYAANAGRDFYWDGHGAFDPGPNPASIVYGIDTEEGLVVSRIGDEVAFPVLDFEAIGKGGDGFEPGDFRGPTRYNLEKFPLRGSPGVRWRDVDVTVAVKNVHRKFWGLSELPVPSTETSTDTTEES